MSSTIGKSTLDGREKETASLISAEKVKGTSVFNTAGELLGAIHDIMLDKRRGQVSLR